MDNLPCASLNACFFFFPHTIRYIRTSSNATDILASQVIADSKGSTIQRIFIFPQSRPRKKVPIFDLHRVCWAMEKYSSYKIRRAKKVVYRLKHQNRKQKVARNVEGMVVNSIISFLPKFLLIV